MPSPLGRPDCLSRQIHTLGLPLTSSCNQHVEQLVRHYHISCNKQGNVTRLRGRILWGVLMVSRCSNFRRCAVDQHSSGWQVVPRFWPLCVVHVASYVAFSGWQTSECLESRKAVRLSSRDVGTHGNINIDIDSKVAHTSNQLYRVIVIEALYCT